MSLESARRRTVRCCKLCCVHRAAPPKDGSLSRGEMLRRWQGFLGGAEAERPKAPRGLYMYGGVGTGKTMLMDLFAESAPPQFQASPSYVECMPLLRMTGPN